MSSNKHFDNLLRYALELEVSVEDVEILDPDGLFKVALYDFGENKILFTGSLNRDDPYSWFVLAHEIGHAKDFLNHSDIDNYKSIASVASFTFNDCVSSGVQVPIEIVKFIKAAEKRATEHGKQVLKELNIPISKKEILAFSENAEVGYDLLMKAGLDWKKFF